MYVGSWFYLVFVDWLFGGRSECKLVINCKKGAGFKWAKGWSLAFVTGGDWWLGWEIYTN